MIRRVPFSSLLFAFVLTWGAWTNCPAADPTDKPHDAQVEDEEVPAVQPPKKKAKHRVAFSASSHDEIVEIGRNVVIPAGESVRELVVIAGNATVDGRVRGNLVVISGSAKVNGRVDNQWVTILGSATAGPKADIRGDAVVVGGPFRVDPQANIQGQRTVIAMGQVIPDFVWLQKWIAKGLFLARPFPPEVRWVWIVAILFLLVYLALAVLLPRPIRVCVDILERQPISSFFAGIVPFVLFLPVVILLVLSMAGILVIPFVICGLIGASLLGKATVYSFAGQQLGRQMRMSDQGVPSLLLLGAVLFYVIYMIPVLGFVVWALVTVVGLGAVLLAGLRSFRGIPASAEPLTSEPSAGPPPPSTTSHLAIAAAPPVLSGSEILLFPRVGFWRRFWATALDGLLLGMLLPLTGGLFLVLWVAYFIAMWTWKGTTIGGIVLSIKIVRVDGQPLNFAVAFVRSLSTFFSAFALFLGFFWAGWDRERQAWHDKIAGTVVVRVPRSMSLL